MGAANNIYYYMFYIDYSFISRLSKYNHSYSYNIPESPTIHSLSQMFDEEAQGATIRIGHLIEGDTHSLDRSIIGDTWAETIVGLLRDQWGGQFAKELLMQAGYRVYIICLKIAWIIEVR